MTAKIAFLILLLSSSAVFAEEQAQKFPFVGKPAKDDVNIRAGNDQNFEILTKVNTDDLLFITEQSYGWYRVRLPKSAHCYVAKDFVDKKDQEAVSKASNLNVRARPNKESSVIGQLKKGDVITILAEETGGWYEILPPSDSYGWVRSEFLEPYQPAEEEGPKPVEEAKPVEKPKKKRFLWW